MKDSDIESIFKLHAEHSIVAALRMIYNLGYCDGAGVVPTNTTGDKSASATKPTAAAMDALKPQVKGAVK